MSYTINKKDATIDRPEKKVRRDLEKSLWNLKRSNNCQTNIVQNPLKRLDKCNIRDVQNDLFFKKRKSFPSAKKIQLYTDT